MLGRDYNIFVYAPEGPSIPGGNLVPCLTEDTRLKIFGSDDPNRLPSWPTEQQSASFNFYVIRALKKEIEKEDLILLTAGWSHRPISEAFPAHIICEPGVGYEGILPNSHCAFESYAWMHHVYAKKNINDGRWFDTVIPNFFDPDEFPHLNNGKGQYLLFLGRIVQRKGPHIAAQIADKAGYPLYVAGAGGKQVGNDIVAPEVTVRNATYIGPVNIKQRAELLAGARALLFCTTYIEPFGGVMVEAMMAGTPVIATDWGAPTEIVEKFFNGFRFRNFAEALDAVKLVGDCDPFCIQHEARSRYSLKAVAPKYQRWFDQLSSLWKEGWYAPR
jgi:glycosyltransferase involved in cell wall biosynthesis